MADGGNAVSKYELVGIEVAEIKRRIADFRFAMNDADYRDLLREVKALVWEQESRLDGIVTPPGDRRCDRCGDLLLGVNDYRCPCDD